MLWWIAAGFVVGAELLTGTVYLLLLSIGMAVAGLSAWMGAPLPTQMLVCAVVGGVAMALLWWWRLRTSRSRPAAEFDLDIGHRVHVARWQPDGLATVHYRGAPWQARWTGEVPPPGPGEFAIVAVDGARLVLGPLSSTRTP